MTEAGEELVRKIVDAADAVIVKDRESALAEAVVYLAAVARPKRIIRRGSDD